ARRRRRPDRRRRRLRARRDRARRRRRRAAPTHPRGRVPRPHGTEPAMSTTTTSRVLAQTAFETRAVLRNGEQLLLTFILPAIALVLLVRTDVLGAGDRHATALAGVLALAAVSTGFTSQAIAVAFDRRWGVLRLLATT